MNCDAITHQLQREFMTRNQTFKIVVAGEDFVAVMRGQVLARRLAAELNPQFEVSTDAWKFEDLSNHKVSEAAARGIAEADIIIIAASADDELPANVKSWIENSLPQKRKGVSALVAACDCETGTPHDSCALSACLQRIAYEREMDFFMQSANGARPGFKFTAERLPVQRRNNWFGGDDDFRPYDALPDCALDG